MFADVDYAPIVVSREDVTSILDESLKGVGLQWASAERQPPWIKDNKKKWEATQWDPGNSSSWDSKKRAKGAKSSAWPAKGADSWSTHDSAAPVFRGASGPGVPPIAWPPVPPPPPADHSGVFQALAVGVPA